MAWVKEQVEQMVDLLPEILLPPLPPMPPIVPSAIVGLLSGTKVVEAHLIIRYSEVG